MINFLLHCVAQVNSFDRDHKGQGAEGNPRARSDDTAFLCKHICIPFESSENILEACSSWSGRVRLEVLRLLYSCCLFLWPVQTCAQRTYNSEDQSEYSLTLGATRQLPVLSISFWILPGRALAVTTMPKYTWPLILLVPFATHWPAVWCGWTSLLSLLYSAGLVLVIGPILWESLFVSTLSLCTFLAFSLLCFLF